MPEATAPPAGADGKVAVHIEATRILTRGGSPFARGHGGTLVGTDVHALVRLEHRSAPNAPWEVVCDGYCDQRVPVGDEYRIVGATINVSPPFHLNGARGDDLTLNVVPKLKSEQTSSTAVAIAGGVLLVAGILVAAKGLSLPSSPGVSGLGNVPRSNLLTVASGLGVGGILGGVFGVTGMVSSRHSSVEGDVLADPPTHDAHVPSDQTGTRTAAPTAPPFVVPLLSATF